MESKRSRNLIAAALAVMMALPAGLAVGGDGIAADSPGSAFAERAIASLGGSDCEVWIEGSQHDARIMLSVNRGGGWTEPRAITGPEFNPMELQMLAGTDALYVAWQDSLSKAFRTCFMVVSPDGMATVPLAFLGGSPSLAVSSRDIAVSFISQGEMTLQVSGDSGMTFRPVQAFGSLACQRGAVSFADGRLEAVAAAGVRDPGTGTVSSAGLYYTRITDWSCSEPLLLAQTRVVSAISFRDGTLTWSEASASSVDTYTMAEESPGVFAAKTLENSESLTEAPEPVHGTQARLPPKKWTFVCYLDGDNSLSSFATEDLNEMEMTGSTDDVNIIALFDGSGSSDSRGYYVTYDTSGSIGSTVIPLSSINSTWVAEVNMGNPQTAIDLMEYVYEHYPAQRYAWDFWNHGGSWTWMQCEDSVSSDELTALETRKIYEILRAETGRRYLWDVVSFDECIVADNEVVYDAKQYVNYTVFSEDSISGDGFDYQAVTQHLKDNPDMGGEEFGAWICHEYYADYPTGSSLSTLSEVNNTAYDMFLMPAIETFGQKMRHKASSLNSQIKNAASGANDWQGVSYQPDLRHYAQLVTSGISNATDAEINAAAWQVVSNTVSNAASDTFGSGTWVSGRPMVIHDANTNSNGLTIFSNQAYNPTFNTLALATYSNWGKFVQNVWGTPSNVVNEEPYCTMAFPGEGSTIVGNSTVAVSGTAGDTDGSVTMVQVKIEREAWQTAAGTTSWTYQLNTSGWPVGPVYLQARSYDGTDYSEPWTVHVQMVDVPSEGTVDIELALYPGEAAVNIEVADRDLNADPMAAETVNVNLKSAREPAGETALLTETGPNTCLFQGSGAISAADSAGVVWVNPVDTITATYNDADDGTGSPAVVTDTAEVDGLPPAAPTGLTVQHWGLVSGNETRYMRGTAGEANVNGLTAYLAGAEQSSAAANAGNLGNFANLYAGIRAWVRDSAGTETELTSGIPAAIVCGSNTGLWAAAWTPPFTLIEPTDSVVIRFYADTTSPPTTARATFTTEQLEATQIEASQWTVSYFLRKGSIVQGGSSLIWGTADYDTKIAGFAWKSTANYQNHNTLNWTHNGADVDHYVIYRSEMGSGPWDAAHVLDAVMPGANTYTDFGRGLGDSTVWWYVVRAIDPIGNIEANANSVPEPGSAQPYSIDLAGRGANSWVFVSFPHAVSGSIQDLLDDAVLGDGLTVWTRAKWYNPQTPGDPWKTYRAGGQNDLTSVSSLMGLWLYITANGGDQQLTLAVPGDCSPAAVAVNLYTGWNMVGYPSATARLGSATLPGQADRVSVWQAATPYIIDSAPGAVTMSHGNAYWVHVTADCVWTVFP